jgi:hypothetical protein
LNWRCSAPAWLGCWPPKLPGERLGAARTWLNLQQREVTLLGLDAPAQIELAAQQEAATALLAHLETLLEPELMECVIDAVSLI